MNEISAKVLSDSTFQEFKELLAFFRGYAFGVKDRSKGYEEYLMKRLEFLNSFIDDLTLLRDYAKNGGYQKYPGDVSKNFSGDFGSKDFQTTTSGNSGFTFETQSPDQKSFETSEKVETPNVFNEQVDKIGDEIDSLSTEKPKKKGFLKW